MSAPRREGDGAARLHGRGAVAGSARGTVVSVAGPGGASVLVEVDSTVAGALEDMRREAWRIDRREARHTLSLDAMDASVAVAGPESDPVLNLLGRRRTGELAAALAQLPVREIARREGCSERAVKYSLARARKRMRGILSERPLF